MPPKSNLPTYSFEHAPEHAILPSLRGCSTRESRLPNPEDIPTCEEPVLRRRQKFDTQPSNRLETPDLLEQQETAAQIAHVQNQKADSGATYFNRQPVSNAELTKSNLQSSQTTASLELPEALDEWRNILEVAPSRPTQRISQMASLTKSNKSNPSTQSDTKAKNGLTADPVKYAAMMRANHGVQKYGFATPTKGSTHEQHGLAAEKVPANYKEIIEALAKDRDDLPGMNEFAEYCSGMDPPNISPKESEIEIFYRDFLNPKKWRREAHSNGRFTLILQPDLLPTPPDKIEPEMCMGIDPNKLGKRSWVGKHLPGHVRNRLLICINSVVEHKSSEGSIITARIQNQAAAKLLCDAWLVDEQTLRELRSVEEFVTVANSASQRLGSALVTKTAEQLPSIDGGVIGRASIGSLCFDGNTLEASVHWLDESNSSVTRKYDMFSLRVGTGHVFAVDLAEFQATYKKFANFLDWLFHVRDKRLQQIMTLPESEFSTLAKPMPNLGGRANKPALLSPKEQGRQPDLQPAILDSQPSLQVPQQSTNSTAEYFSTGKVRKQPTRDQQKMKKRKRSDSNVTTLAGATTSRSKKRRSTRAG